MPLPTVEIDGHRLEYEDRPGDPDRAPLLFLHEGLGSVGLWREFPWRIAGATGRRAVAYSRWGHGGSDPVRRGVDVMEREAADVLPRLLAALRLEGPVLVGHSDGATIALLHAAAAPDDAVAGVVALAPHVLVEEGGLAAITRTAEAFRDGTLRAGLARHHRDPDVVFDNWYGTWSDPGFRAWDVRDRMAGLRCPVLLVQGAADEYGTMAHVEAVAARAAGPTRILRLPCGHSPHLQCAAETEYAVTVFVDGLP